MLSVNFITNRIFNSRTYILTSPSYNKVWLVDCGDIDKIIELLEKPVEGVLLTHAHFDHIYGLKDLIKLFPQVRIVTNCAGAEGLKSPRLNISHYHKEYQDLSIEARKNVDVLTEGEPFEIMGTPVQVYETPGHAPSCITYIIEDKAFTGDAYIPGVKVFAGFPHSNREYAQESVKRILQLTSHCLIMPGHTVAENADKMNY